MSPAILALLFAARHPDADLAMGLRQLAAPRYATREAGQQRVEWACRRDARNLDAVARLAASSPDPEVRMRAARVLRSIARCVLCGGAGSVEPRYRRDYYKPECDLCHGTGTTHLLEH